MASTVAQVYSEGLGLCPQWGTGQGPWSRS